MFTRRFRILVALSGILGPALFFPLGIVILGSRVLPRVFGYLAFVLGGAFAIAGIVGLFSPIQNLVNYLSIIQAAWWLIAAITLIVRAGRASETAAVQEREGVTAF